MYASEAIGFEGYEEGPWRASFMVGNLMSSSIEIGSFSRLAWAPEVWISLGLSAPLVLAIRSFLVYECF